MRPAAQIDEFALAVQADFFARRNRADDFSFVVFALRLEKSDRLVATPDFARDWLVFFRQFRHFVFNRDQILGCERALVSKVVVKTVLNHRPDGHLRIGIQRFDRIREQMRG